LKFLKSQINPHFLFNSLNAVYFLIDKSNREARESLHKFSRCFDTSYMNVEVRKIEIEKKSRTCRIMWTSSASGRMKNIKWNFFALTR
jgi:LytS/YehU family sensor histidine kinase